MVILPKLTFGVALGVVFGIWSLINTNLAPLAEDTIPALLVFYGPMFAIWAYVGFAAYRKTGRLVDAVLSGVIVGATTILTFSLIAFIRVNVFLETISQRSDWQELVRAFPDSGFETFRAYVNYSYATQILPKVTAGTCIGALTGLLGGVVRKLTRGGNAMLPGHPAKTSFPR